LKRYEFHGIRLVLEEQCSILQLRNAVHHVEVLSKLNLAKNWH